MKLIDKIIWIYATSLGIIVVFTGVFPNTLNLVKYEPYSGYSRSSLQSVNVENYDNFFLSMLILLVGLIILGVVRKLTTKNH